MSDEDIADEDWRPDWTESDYPFLRSLVGRLLREGRYRSVLERDEQRFRGTNWWDRQFNGTARAAHSDHENNVAIIERHARDAPRVLEKIRTNWDRYLGLVHRHRGERMVARAIKEARRSGAHLFVLIVNEFLQGTWHLGGHAAGMEASNMSVYSKIGGDNKFLWSYDEFGKMFNPGFFDL